MGRKLILFALILLSLSCARERRSEVLCKSISLENGFRQADSLGNFSIIVPDSSWYPLDFTANNHSSLFIGDTLGERFYVLNFSYEKLLYPWNSKEEELKLKQRFQVLEDGTSDIGLKKYRWFRIRNEDKTSGLLLNTHSTDYSFNIMFHDIGFELPESIICVFSPLISSLQVINEMN